MTSGSPVRKRPAGGAIPAVPTVEMTSIGEVMASSGTAAASFSREQKHSDWDTFDEAVFLEMIQPLAVNTLLTSRTRSSSNAPGGTKVLIQSRESLLCWATCGKGATKGQRSTGRMFSRDSRRCCLRIPAPVAWPMNALLLQRQQLKNLLATWHWQVGSGRNRAAKQSLRTSWGKAVKRPGQLRH